MGLCKCPKRKVTNLFCFEHDVNVCECCLVTDHEGCIVQSYVQWLQDSDYNPICILCKKLLKEEPTVRLVCLDVFHWSCLNKYACELPADTAPAGYQCPKCKECMFPPPNLVSPVVDALRKKLETVSWSRVGLGQSLLPGTATASSETELSGKEASEKKPLLTSTGADEESNGYVIVSQQQKDNRPAGSLAQTANAQQTAGANKATMPRQASAIKSTTRSDIPSTSQLATAANSKLETARSKFDVPDLDSITPVYHNRAIGHIVSNQEQTYDPNLGIVLNIDKLDRDTGEMKYKRRPLLEWFSRFLRSRQLNTKRLRLTRQKKYLFLVLVLLMALFTLIVIFSRLGTINTENDPALDPMNNPNIRVQ